MLKVVLAVLLLVDNVDSVELASFAEEVVLTIVVVVSEGFVFEAVKVEVVIA